MANNNHRPQRPVQPQGQQSPQMPVRRPLAAQEPIQPKRGLKINNQASSIPAPQPSQQAMKQELQAQAKSAQSKQDDYNDRTIALIPRFRDMVKDRTLADNKSVIAKDLEKEVCRKLVDLASEMNADDTQPEGVGGLSIGTLLMQMVLVMRDNTNSIDYRVEQLEKKIVALQAENVALREAAKK